MNAPAFVRTRPVNTAFMATTQAQTAIRMILGVRPVRGVFDAAWGDRDRDLDCMHVLNFPNQAHAIRAAFVTNPALPGEVFIRTTCWRAENETTALYTRERAREFWRSLTQAGFVPPMLEG